MANRLFFSADIFLWWSRILMCWPFFFNKRQKNHGKPLSTFNRNTMYVPNFSSNWSEVCTNVQFQQFRTFKVCAKNTENQKSRDRQNNNKMQINKWWHQHTKHEPEKCNKRTHGSKTMNGNERRKKWLEKTSKHRRISVDVCHFVFSLLDSASHFLFDHFVYVDNE